MINLILILSKNKNLNQRNKDLLNGNANFNNAEFKF